MEGTDIAGWHGLILLRCLGEQRDRKKALNMAVRPKKLREWEMLIAVRLNLAVAPVIGVVPSKIMFPSKKEYVRLTAFECKGVMR